MPTNVISNALSPEARVARALDLHRAGHLGPALAEVDAALAVAPTLIGARFMRAVVLGEQGDAAAAVQIYDGVLREVPRHVDALTNRGTALLRLGRFDAALTDLEAAVATDPNYATAHFNLARGYAMLNRVPDALVSYDRALTLNPGDAKTLWAKGVAQLLAGDFANGWANYGSRWQAADFGNSAPRDFGTPRYTGAEPLAGRTLFIHAEQGFGDTIQFCRYIPILAATGARVLFMVQDELLGLMGASGLPCTLLASGASVPRWDYDLPLMNAPVALKTTLATVPAWVPYLVPPPEKVARWRELLGPRTRPRVGLVWSGRRTHRDDHLRSVPIAALGPLLALNAEFHVLQTEIADAERGVLAGRARIFDIENRDFGDAAAHVAAMDHVVSVDTSLAHLAGALAKPVSILLAAAPDFRWMLERSDSPWYPTATLIRQAGLGVWDDVVARVVAQVKTVLKSEEGR